MTVCVAKHSGRLQTVASLESRVVAVLYRNSGIAFNRSLVLNGIFYRIRISGEINGNLSRKLKEDLNPFEIGVSIHSFVCLFLLVLY